MAQELTSISYVYKRLNSGHRAAILLLNFFVRGVEDGGVFIHQNWFYHTVTVVSYSNV